MCVLLAATTATTIDDSSSTDDLIAAMQNELKRSFLSLLDMSESPSSHPPRECVPEFMSDLQAHGRDVEALFSTFGKRGGGIHQIHYVYELFNVLLIETLK